MVRSLSQDKQAMGNSKDWVIVLCPGFHPADLTQCFLEHLETMNLQSVRIVVFPSDRYLAYSVPDVLFFLREHLSQESHQWRKIPLVLIGFSAGVVGAMGAASLWEIWGGKVLAVFALDGWGVPVLGHFPTHRISHDQFTHWSSALLGTGQDSFYADPEVEHLALWRSPHLVQGCWVSTQTQATTQVTLLQFLAHWLHRYQSATLRSSQAD